MTQTGDSSIRRTPSNPRASKSDTPRRQRREPATRAAPAGGWSRVPGKRCSHPRPPRNVATPFDSNRMSAVASAWNSVLISSVTGSNTAAGSAPPATRVATRRNAACSSAIRRSSSRASALSTAVATSSVNRAICDSVPVGNGSSRLVEAAITPHSCPATVMGHPIEERMPTVWASRAIAPVCQRSSPAALHRPYAVRRGRCWTHQGRTASRRPVGPAPGSRRRRRSRSHLAHSAPCGLDRRRTRYLPPA